MTYDISNCSFIHCLCCFSYPPPTQPSMHGTLMQALHYLLLISEVDDSEIFKVCLEYWNFLASSLYNESGRAEMSFGMPMMPAVTPRRMLYNEVLSKVRHIMVSKMARPEEVLIVETPDGEVIREKMKDTNAIELYKFMQETLSMRNTNKCKIKKRENRKNKKKNKKKKKKKEEE